MQNEGQLPGRSRRHDGPGATLGENRAMTVNQADEHPPAIRDTSADPRDIITPEAFRVLPALYGLPLAGPWRRLSAIAIDALLVVVLAQSGGLLLAVAAAVLFFSWVDSRGSGGGIGRGLRSLVGISGSVMLFIAVLAIVQPLLDRWDDDEDLPAQATGTLEGGDAVAAGLGLARLHACDDAPCRETELDRLASALAQSQMPVEQRRDLLLELASGAAEEPEERVRLEQRIEAALPPPAAAADALPRKSEDDEASARSQRMVGEDGSFSVLRTLKSLADDLGFSFGWGAVYFTLLTVLWDGQTLGKRWLGIRVIALNGRPLSYWEAFNRYGGYAAGFATGLLGFLQVFWDPNRQAIHDQISFTAVIRDVRGEALAQLRAARAAAASESQAQV